jgi:hypothetical protein
MEPELRTFLFTWPAIAWSLILEDADETILVPVLILPSSEDKGSRFYFYGSSGKYQLSLSRTFATKSFKYEPIN